LRISVPARFCQIRGDSLLHPLSNRDARGRSRVLHARNHLGTSTEVELLGAPGGAQTALVHRVRNLLALLLPRLLARLFRFCSPQLARFPDVECVALFSHGRAPSWCPLQPAASRSLLGARPRTIAWRLPI